MRRPVFVFDAVVHVDRLAFVVVVVELSSTFKSYVLFHSFHLDQGHHTSQIPNPCETVGQPTEMPIRFHTTTRSRRCCCHEQWPCRSFSGGPAGFATTKSRTREGNDPSTFPVLKQSFSTSFLLHERRCAC